MKAPTTDRTLGIALNSNTKFADVRKKATDEYIERCKKRKKDKKVCVPRYKIGDLVVIGQRYARMGSYLLIEIVDFEPMSGGFDYFGIVCKATSKSGTERIGRLVRTGWFDDILPIPIDSVKWQEATE